MIEFFTVSNLKNDPFLYEVSIINGYLEIKNKKEFSDFNPSNVFCGASEIILYGEFKKGKTIEVELCFWITTYNL
ncbi:hypothetical protein LEP1GSC124_5223 [Leptospira interrogans serovar Pyrogenes str. 200701872]|uniref:Uncharacterized protein n=1 Tax=Leptospira interrogans serovar Pyrogenes str. 200701872 TaxID=1193029 RepID=M7A5R1_LEPIR|nr:hypothetical protein LEP1GSC124_5223 [Leptospira interrogans serovar Pyrogenes str. 200701872]